MASTFTPNVGFEEPARGDLVGVWDTPQDNNISALDLIGGSNAIMGVTNSNVVLTAAQYKSRMITFTGNLTASIAITFPQNFLKSYDIQNLCTGSTSFYIALTTNIVGSTYICAPPGQIVSVLNDGTNIKLKNQAAIGTYIDYAGNTLPLWVAISGTYGIAQGTPKPYLNCDGSTFSAVNYPILAAVLGGTTLPDWRGRTGATLNQGTGRINATVAGDTIFSGGGDQNLQAHSHTGTTNNENANHNHIYVEVVSGNIGIDGRTGGFPCATGLVQTAIVTGNEQQSHAHAFTSNTTGAGAGQNMSPTVIYGITMIRAF